MHVNPAPKERLIKKAPVALLQNILFLDIETVAQHASFEELDPTGQRLFEKKTAYQRRDGISASEFYERAGIWAEFGKVVCISVAFLQNLDGRPGFVSKSFFGHDEKYILQQFKRLLQRSFDKKNHVLCAHNGKEFDFPYLARRMLINRISLPEILDLFGKKPWEVRHLDTMEMWRFGDFKQYTSLELLAYVFGIPSPKNELEGSAVNRQYHEKGDLRAIVAYCERDVMAVVRLYLSLRAREEKLAVPI